MGTCAFTWCFPMLSRSRSSSRRMSTAAAAPLSALQLGPPQLEERGLDHVAVTAPVSEELRTGIRNDSILVSTVMDAIGLLPENANVTQPLPSVTEPQRFILRSISIGDNTGDGSFSGAAVILDTDTVAGAVPLRLEVPNRDAAGRNLGVAPRLLQTSPLAGIETPSRSASVKETTVRGSAASAMRGSGSNTGAGPVTLLDLANDLDSLTTADLTLDIVATGANVLLWPDSQTTGRAVPPSSSRPTVHGGDAHLPDHSHLVESAHPNSPTNVVKPGAAATLTTGPQGDPAAAQTASVTTRSVLNLSQVRDFVQDLRVLHIRPGAALLIGKSIANDKSVVARFERGQPASLLAPQLLSSLEGSKCRAHPNVVTLMGVHAVALPAQVLETPLPRASPLPIQPLSHGIGSAGRAAVVAYEPTCEFLNGDLAVATRALQQAEVVRGASNGGSGLIGSALGSSSMRLHSGTGEGSLAHTFATPQVRLRDVVGHLRASTGHACGSASSSFHGRQHHHHHHGHHQPPLAFGANSLSPLTAAANVAFVTLSIMELCDAGNLWDEIRRGAFRCCLMEPPPRLNALRSSVDGGGPGDVSCNRNTLRCFSNTQFLRRLDRFLVIARQIAQGLHFLHTVFHLAHGDLVSRNVLLHGSSSSCDAWVCGATGYMAKLAGYGRLPAAEVATATPDPMMGVDSVSRGSGCEGSTTCTGDATTHISATSLSRVNSVHVGLWRDVHSLAPERLRYPQAPPTFEADVYAYGTILYEMAVGESPWASMLPACMAVGVATGELRINWNQSSGPSGSTFGTGAGSGAPLPCIAGLVERCTSPQPESRPSLEQILDALDGIEEEVRIVRELAESRRQQCRSARLVRTFMSSNSSLESRTATGDGSSDGSSWIDCAACERE